MKRNITQQLQAWKEKTDRKPLIVNGARQVGKTYSLKEFGREAYENVAYINCDGNEEVTNIFAQDYDMHRILLHLSALTGVDIRPGKTLIIIDEIQECPKALNSLKYFCENAPQYHVAVAGSLLGISLHAGSSFPVGKVDMIKMYRNTTMRLPTHQNNLYPFERIGGNAETDSIPVQTSWKQSKHFTKHLSLKLAI